MVGRNATLWSSLATMQWKETVNPWAAVFEKGETFTCPFTKAAVAAAKSLQSCPTVRPHTGQPTRFPHPWDSPGKNRGMGCHFLLQCMKLKSVLSRVWLLVIPWTEAYQAPPPIGFSGQEYWSGVPLPSPLPQHKSSHRRYINGPGFVQRKLYLQNKQWLRSHPGNTVCWPLS